MGHPSVSGMRSISEQINVYVIGKNPSYSHEQDGKTTKIE